ncbi:MAG TPA: carboxypeptidase-like regulatory domain-containing protein, partial [Cyclobacteriaceae bacterium]|nr:carboxypeptidase-like regulatory domain-containing protein [Cyclobacteriaceae bacterium]
MKRKRLDRPRSIRHQTWLGYVGCLLLFSPQLAEGLPVNPHITAETMLDIGPAALKVYIPITGTVTDPDGNPIPGATVLIEGSATGTATDLEGNFSLDVPEGAVLVVSFIGYSSQKVVVGNQSHLKVILEEDVSALDEVVVVGYGTQAVRDVTGALSSVNAENVEDMFATDPSEILKGTVSGITVIESNIPGEPADIRIRGLGTINNNDPLWIVDGVPGSAVPPNNIESITILKDASAQAIYGARASSGVILVTTKTGRKNQKLQINVGVKGGFSKNVNSYDLLNTREFGELEWLMARNAGIDNYSHTLYGSGSEPDIPEYILPARGT